MSARVRIESGVVRSTTASPFNRNYPSCVIRRARRRPRNAGRFSSSTPVPWPPLLRSAAIFQPSRCSASLIALCNQSFAVVQYLLTVAGEIPKTCEVSSIESPLKKRSSTTRHCCGSSLARPFNASSRAMRSTQRLCGSTMASSSVSLYCRYRKLDLGKKRKAHHSVCGSVIASPARKRQRVCFSGVADGADVRRQHLY